ncbi:MAG: hypothetical protein EON98_09930 [Chitinophagaceae bacterium]|nr:MAG: hypothetical protein EON98_09930 [Chitinophagaceae bacterium]
MRNSNKDFKFYFPLKHKVVRDLKIVTDHIGDLEVEGVGYFDPSASMLDIFDRYSVDIDFVRWNGTDIKPVLEVTGGLDEIIEASIRHFANEFESGMERAA